MPKYPGRRLLICAVALFLTAGFLLVDSSAQKRKRKRTTSRPSAPRITNPAIYQPSPNENANSNSGDSNTNSAEATPSETQPVRPAEDESQKTIRNLSNQVDKLTDKISQMEESQRSLVDLERLSRAEARSSALQTELRDVMAKKADLEVRAEDIDFALRPENIERSTAGYGTTRPEDMREQRRKQLENEKVRVSKQIELLAASQTRLEQAIATSDAEVERLRKKLDAADEAAIQNAKTKAQTEGTTSGSTEPQPKSSPTPYPPQ